MSEDIEDLEDDPDVLFISGWTDDEGVDHVRTVARRPTSPVGTPLTEPTPALARDAIP
jgi:hypothetical protein